MRWGAVEHMLLDILVDAPSEYDGSTMTLRSVESGFSLVIMGLMTDQGINGARGMGHAGRQVWFLWQCTP